MDWSSERSLGVAVLGGRQATGRRRTAYLVPWLGRPGDVALFGVCGENYNQSADGGGYRTRSAGGVGRNAQQAYEPDEYRECDHV